MMKTNLIKTAGLLVLTTFMVTGLNAQSTRYGGALDLSEEQQEAMTTLRTSHYKTMTPLKNKMAELKAKERTLISEESVDLNAVNKLIDEQTDLSNQMRKIQVAHKVEVKKILSDEQIMKLDQRRNFTRNRGYKGRGQSHGKGVHRGQRNARSHHRPYHRNMG